MFVHDTSTDIFNCVSFRLLRSYCASNKSKKKKKNKNYTDPKVLYIICAVYVDCATTVWYFFCQNRDARHMSPHNWFGRHVCTLCVRSIVVPEIDDNLFEQVKFARRHIAKCLRESIVGTGHTPSAIWSKSKTNNQHSVAVAFGEINKWQRPVDI